VLSRIQETVCCFDLFDWYWGIVPVPEFRHERAKGARTHVWESPTYLLALSALSPLSGGQGKEVLGGTGRGGEGVQETRVAGPSALTTSLAILIASSSYLNGPTLPRWQPGAFDLVNPGVVLSCLQTTQFRHNVSSKFVFLFVCLLIIKNTEILYFASRCGLEVNPKLLLLFLVCSNLFFLGFWIHTASRRAKYCRNAHRWRCSNKEVRKRLARRHSRDGPWTHECCHGFEVDVCIC